MIYLVLKYRVENKKIKQFSMLMKSPAYPKSIKIELCS